MRHDGGPVAAASQAFFHWYFPRFLAKTFALARQDEFEADRIAGKLVGREIAGAALTEIAIKSEWLDTAFWPLHWSAAAHNAQPVGPFAAMRTLLADPTLSARMGVAGRARVETTFSVSRMVQQTTALYRSAIEETA